LVCHGGQCDMVVADYNLKKAKLQTSGDLVQSDEAFTRGADRMNEMLK
jgi:hypothetical protein